MERFYKSMVIEAKVKTTTQITFEIDVSPKRAFWTHQRPLRGSKNVDHVIYSSRLEINRNRGRPVPPPPVKVQSGSRRAPGISERGRPPIGAAGAGAVGARCDVSRLARGRQAMGRRAAPEKAPPATAPRATRLTSSEREGGQP
ncbi:hypothetical protein EVAR_46291_1 [Eumeta japonica]|uniref:Uncharacterized protein n=1 Tax=Eumeta variegata TaxID=151549 RepID=A0A4C1XX30_EUMVA|nr:hypothetical protein EVAR_46291_1 [Eumeta japonica]